MVTGPAVSCRASPATSGQHGDDELVLVVGEPKMLRGCPARPGRCRHNHRWWRTGTTTSRSRTPADLSAGVPAGELRGEDAEGQRLRVGSRYEQHPVPEPQRASFAAPWWHPGRADEVRDLGHQAPGQGPDGPRIGGRPRGGQAPARAGKSAEQSSSGRIAPPVPSTGGVGSSLRRVGTVACRW